MAGGNDPYRAMIEHFRAVVRGETWPRRTAADAVALLAVVDRLRDAALVPAAARDGRRDEPGHRAAPVG